MNSSSDLASSAQRLLNVGVAGKDYLVSIVREDGSVEARAYTRDSPARVVAVVVCTADKEGEDGAAEALRALAGDYHSRLAGRYVRRKS